MLDNKALTGLVEAVIRRQFPDDVIYAVPVKPDVDHDGDDILRVAVVVRDGNQELDPEKVLDTSRSLWFELGEARIESFPSVSYMTGSDAAALRESV